MKYPRIIITFLILLAVGFSAYLFFNPKNMPRIEVIQTNSDIKVINIHTTLAQIKRDIAPIVIEDFLGQNKIIATNDGLKLADFKNNSVLARYGFEKGDIVREVNGQGLKTIPQAIEICEKLEAELFKDRGAKEVYFSLNRDGNDIKMSFLIPEFVPEKITYTMTLQKVRAQE